MWVCQELVDEVLVILLHTPGVTVSNPEDLVRRELLQTGQPQLLVALILYILAVSVVCSLLTSQIRNVFSLRGRSIGAVHVPRFFPGSTVCCIGSRHIVPYR